MISDKTQALLDLLAGWGEFIIEQQERGEEEADEGYAERLRDYPEAYSELVFRLYQSVTTAVEDEGLTPAEFLQRRVLPLFEESER